MYYYRARHRILPPCPSVPVRLAVVGSVRVLKAGISSFICAKCCNFAASTTAVWHALTCLPVSLPAPARPVNGNKSQLH